MKKLILKRDLRQNGAGAHEADELTKLAGQFEHIKLKGLSAHSKDHIARIPGKPVHYFQFPVKYALGGALAAVLVIAGFAQTARPGNALYGIKLGTEEVRTWVQPEYIDNIVEERKDEVEKLKVEQAKPEQIEKAEREYEESKQRSEQRKKRNHRQEGNDKQKDEPDKSDGSRHRRQNRDRDDRRRDRNDNNNDSDRR